MKANYKITLLKIFTLYYLHAIDWRQVEMKRKKNKIIIYSINIKI